MAEKEEPLLVKNASGNYRWGRYQGFSDSYHCCLLARVSGGRPILSPPHEADAYGLDRELTEAEVHAIGAADDEEASEEDRKVILKLAREIGVSV